MNIIRKVRYWVTGDDNLLAQQTGNGVQPLDPPQDVTQNQEVCDGDR